MWAASLVHAAVSTTPLSGMTPGLNSVFISLGAGGDRGPSWNATRWSLMLDDLRAIDVDNIIISDAVTDSTAWYPSKIPGLTYDGVDVLGMALAAADAAGVSVYMGMLLPSNWFHNGAMNATYLRELTARVDTVATELHSLFGAHASLQGFYHAAEVYSTCCYSPTNRCDAAHIGALASMLEPTGQLVHSLRREYKYVIAPFAQNVSAAGAYAAEAAWWASLLALIPSVDIVAMQDGVGVSGGRRSPQEASALIGAVAGALPSGMTIWTDVEAFVKLDPGHSKVAPTARFLQQLELEAPYVTGQTIWEFTMYMDPRGCHAVETECRRLYNDYKHYVESTIPRPADPRARIVRGQAQQR